VAVTLVATFRHPYATDDECGSVNINARVKPRGQARPTKHWCRRPDKHDGPHNRFHLSDDWPQISAAAMREPIPWTAHNIWTTGLLEYRAVADMARALWSCSGPDTWTPGELCKAQGRLSLLVTYLRDYVLPHYDLDGDGDATAVARLLITLAAMEEG
jgi:hypothetical protein